MRKRQKKKNRKKEENTRYVISWNSAGFTILEVWVKKK